MIPKESGIKTYNMLGLGNTALSDYEHVFRDNYSLSFNGVDEYVDCGGMFSGSREISKVTGSISLWAKINTTSSTGNIFRMQYDNNNFISIYYHAGSNETRTGFKGSGTTVTAVMTTEVEADDTWHNIVSTWEGKLIHTKSPGAGLPAMAENDFESANIGSNTSGGTFFNGLVNDVSIFNVTLSSDEISSLYNNRVSNDLIQTQNSARALVAYYKFENGTGTVVYDSSENRNNVNMVNTPTWSTDTPQ